MKLFVYKSLDDYDYGVENIVGIWEVPDNFSPKYALDSYCQYKEFRIVQLKIERPDLLTKNLKPTKKLKALVMSFEDWMSQQYQKREYEEYCP